MDTSVYQAVTWAIVTHIYAPVALAVWLHLLYQWWLRFRLRRRLKRVEKKIEALEKLY